jgi:1,4-alpha-glucan branching enzyme
MNTGTCELSPTLPPQRYSARRTIHHVDFFCDAPKAGRVCLAGDFNNWNPTATPMRRMPDGRWMASLELHHGHHQYLFLVDGAPKLDPNANGIARNDRNEPVSLIAVS